MQQRRLTRGRRRNWREKSDKSKNRFLKNHRAIPGKWKNEAAKRREKEKGNAETMMINRENALAKKTPPPPPSSLTRSEGKNGKIDASSMLTTKRKKMVEKGKERRGTAVERLDQRTKK